MADFPIVGIGSSAGGLEALQKLFGAMPPESGLAFVVAAHLDPTHESHLTSLLGRCTAMPVAEVENSVKVEPDHVYVIAPDQELTIKGGVLHTNKPTVPRGHRHPVDSFFRSLAEDQGERAIAIVLSGTGSNGSLGLRFIKAEGGIVLVQDPETAGFEGMPRSAIATGIVDLVLPPESIPEALLNLARHPYVRQPAETTVEQTPEEQLNALLTIIRSNTRQDFSGYRKRTLLRRIQRRMGLHRIDALSDYIERLRNDPREVKALAADLTINVTGFFRDPAAWKTLGEKVVAPLVRERPTESMIRVWVPGCSTGEEAYSIAMLIIEHAEQARKEFQLKLFATDIAAGVLGSARGGVYPSSITQDVTAERLERFFEHEDDVYCVRKALREMIIFAPQNLLQDPPFSRLDLISCRNLLIYLEPEVQRRLLGLFHFALREGGHLILGPAETVAGREELFQTVSKKWRIYRRLGPTRHEVVDFPVIHAAPGSSVEAVAPVEPGISAGALMDRVLIDRHAPASALIDSRYHVHYLRGPTEEYLRPPSGEPSYNLLAMAREGLQTALRMAVRRAIEDGREVATDARVRRGETLHPVRVVVAPLRAQHNSGRRLLVSFFERETPDDEAATEAHEVPDGRHLQAELDSTREDLRLTLEQMEASNEELQASNEEIRSINEELQAANEELETSKEELQSLNEELNTVNNQLQAKVAELEQRTDDLNNLLNSTDIATLFLDRSLRIRWFTPSMKALLDLLPSDIGRPISHFAPRFRGGDLLEDAKKVLERLLPSDAEVVDDLGRWYIRHIVPYRTAADRIEGVVVTFTDITARKYAEEELQKSKDFAEGIVDSMPVALLVLTPSLTVHATNKAFCELFQVTREEALGRHLFDDLSKRKWDIPELRRQVEEVLPKHKQVAAFEVEWEFAQMGRRTMLLHARQLDAVQLVLLAIQDITERKRAEQAVRASEERLRRVLETDAVGVLFFEENGIVIDANDVFLRMTGYSRSEVEARQLTWRKMTPPEWLDVSAEQMARLEATGHLGPYEKEYVLKDGSRSWMLFAGASLGDGTFVEYVIDISGRKRAEQERELLSRELSHRVKNTLAVVQALAMQTDDSSSVQEYRGKFLGRLSALARAHSMLLDAQWRGADLKQLVEQALHAYQIDRPQVVEMDGDPLPLPPSHSLGLSLILHELGTNAAKYGALSSSKGRVRVSWWVEDGEEGRRARLRWEETGGPQIAPPTKKGFGLRLIERACTHELGGAVELDYAPEGLRCEVVFPLD